MPDSQGIELLIDHGHEERNLEYKQSSSWDQLKVKVAKTCMGMANIRDGGFIAIGVMKSQSKYDPIGMDKTHIATYDEDKIRGFVNKYAEPAVRIDLRTIEHKGKPFMLIVVHEFEEVPIVCKAGYEELLRQGAMYTRSNRIPETREVQSQSETREILELAVDKGIKKFLARARRIGIPIDQLVMPELTDPKAFEQQLGDI